MRCLGEQGDEVLTEPGLTLTGLAPLVKPNCRLLILGSFPGEASLRQQQYYGHPRNRFWPLLMNILPVSAGITTDSSYEIRSNWLTSLGLGLWDVYAACERVGSLDADIRRSQPNDLAALRSRCPDLQAVIHHGAESYRQRQHSLQLGLTVYGLPSTSPANAAWSLERLASAWRDVVQTHALLPT